VHLVNLIPTKASLATPSVALVQAILKRADLPISTVALAVCILDSLNRGFALNWRLKCPLNSEGGGSTAANQRHTMPPGTGLLAGAADGRRQPQRPHIDSVQPEVIVLAALVVAV